MLNVILMLIILIILVCLFFFNFKRERFQSSETCSFFPENDPNVTNSTECYQRCLNFYMANPTNNSGCIEQGNSNNCIQKCQNFVPSSVSSDGQILPQHCNISQDDIHGPNIHSCITNCQNYGGNVCRQYKKLGADGSVVSEGNYNVYPNPLSVANPENDYSNNCDITDPSTYSSCSPCVQKCMTCEDSCKCTWLDTENNQPCGQMSIQDADINFQNFNLLIRAIPDDKKVILVWDVSKDTYDIKEFLIMINKKGNSEIVKTIKKKFNNVGGNFTHTIENLSNNVPYIINVTAISNANNVKMSNTLEVTPSKVNIINYSQLNKSNKYKDTITTNLFENIMGKTFEINL